MIGNGCAMASLAKLAEYFRKKTNSYPIYESCVCSLNRLATVSLCPNPQLRRRVYLRCRLGAALSPRGSVALSLFPLPLCVCLFRFLLFPRHTFDSETRAAVPAAAAATPPAAAAAADADYFSGISKFLF